MCSLQESYHGKIASTDKSGTFGTVVLGYDEPGMIMTGQKLVAAERCTFAGDQCVVRIFGRYPIKQFSGAQMWILLNGTAPPPSQKQNKLN